MVTMRTTFSDFWTDPAKIEADRVWSVRKIRGDDKLTRRDRTVIARYLEHSIGIPEGRQEVAD